MSSYAPVYRPAATQQSFLTREQKRERKRKRNTLDSGGSEDDTSSYPDSEEDAPRVLHPVNKTDPYYVAGHAREKPLPGGNFPHAAVKEPRKAQLPAEEELARLKPPVYVPKIAQTDHASSLRARHLDNLTAILHKCMLKDDWERASRTWGLILRTEIAGRGVDVRHNGRWTIGAEILMRQGQIPERVQIRRPSVGSINDHEAGIYEDATVPTPVIKEESFKKARDYYQRLIVQHPHLQRTHHSITSALSIHPAKFSLWIYQVQDNARRERQHIYAASDLTETDLTTGSPGSNRSDQSDLRRKLRQVQSQEHKEALEIAGQLDGLLVSPPYDSSHEMLYTRGMVALWLYDLQMELSRAPSENVTSGTSDDGEGDTTLEQTTTTQAHNQRRRASRIFQKLLATGMELPSSVLAFLDEDEGDGDE